MNRAGARLAHGPGKPHRKRVSNGAQGRSPWADRKPTDPRISTRADREAAEALKVAAGRCERCESDANGLIAVRGPDGRFAAECLDRVACTKRLRRLIAEEGS